ncbi:putative ATP-dependent RNA helicase DHX57 [Condylostylus longicornis]|uniref:putative ATP-dependent RNA helicase DHX57 n=1 Tax=Condylostylus longicornis TaxID=2530218 RepID=UPI00244DFE0C|nr:putative ATP-dependent RNA helicase DHX57 [Condylostylus longicornis]XP_055375618.1 putative ATP-dependent RNA helicase DHX57 [Condylostylus longicornis]
MDGESKKLIDDCFLRPIADARSTNSTTEPISTKKMVKAELQVLRLSEESQEMVMNTLYSIHGTDFQLHDASHYKDMGGKFKKSYWEDRGTLVIQGATNFADFEPNGDIQEVDRFRLFAISKLESFGFPSSHCAEALDFCKGDTEEALKLLFLKYMKCKTSAGDNKKEEMSFDENELLELREDEKMALESIYEKKFKVKEKNRIWSLQFKMDYLLCFSPFEVRKKEKEVLQKLKNEKKKDPLKDICRNYVKGHCKFGHRCRYLHRYPEEIQDNVGLEKINKRDEEHNTFFLEIRFPEKSKYPYEAPLIFLKTTCHDIPREILLKISRKLYREAQELAKDGMPCVFTISEHLQMEDEILSYLKLDNEEFLNSKLSLFYEERNCDSGLEIDIKLKPTHYKLGSIHSSEGQKQDPTKISNDDRDLVKKFLDKQSNPNYKSMLKVRQSLPAWMKMNEILNTIEVSQVVVISGETGCGKSTQVPQFVLDNWLFQSSQLQDVKDVKHVEILCTQPRRLSAIGVAERVAEERNERVGKTVGYQIRLENKISNITRLTFCTTGILLRRLQSDPYLETVSHIIVDEVHERSEETDFLLMILKDILPKRPNLKVILMSATLNANIFSKYFGNVPVIDIPGRTFPVEQIFLEEIVEKSGFVLEADSQYCRKISKKETEDLLNEIEYADIQASNVAPPKGIKDENLNLAAIYARYCDYSRTTCKHIYLADPMKINPELIESVLTYIIDGDHNWPREGSILIFLPGLAEIQAIHDSLCDNPNFSPRSGKYIIVPLHSTLTSEEQSLVFKKAPKGKRKIVLSTNVAETSITIDDCVFVIDYGLMKEKHFDSNKNMESLELVWESRANALQRKGRAGRVMPGVSIHLFTSHRYENHLLSQPIPEIHRVPLEQLLLRLKTLRIFSDRNVIEVMGNIVEPPTEESIVTAIERLQDIGAFDEDQNLTALGHHLSALPVDVRIGKLMLFGAIFHCLDSVLTIAACLSFKSPFVCPFNKRDEAERKKRSFAIHNSDHLTILAAYKKWLEYSKKSRYSGKCFADENFLSIKTLETIIDIKYQFLELLVSIGFVPIDLPSKKSTSNDNIAQLTGLQLNENCDNNRLLVSLLCAALYPNIVKVLTPEKIFTMTSGGALPKVVQASDLRFKTREDGYVAIHPSSTNSQCGHFTSPFLIYQEKIKTSRIFIRECTMIPLKPLVFFSGSDLKIELHDGDFVIIMDKGWILLKAQTLKVAEMIQCLRLELLKLLEEKIKDPLLNLLNHENGKKIIATIIHLVTKD